MRQLSLFESFNARSLEPEQVGRSFVLSPAFTEVAGRTNTIVLGPRGSGKTTLLKMLALPALHNWHLINRGRESKRILDEIDFVAIYVPSDFTWYPEFRRAIKVSPPKEVDDLLSYALFRSYVLLAICETIGYMRNPELVSDDRLSRFYLEPDQLKADCAARLLADSWGLELSLGGLFGLKQSIGHRSRAIQLLLTIASKQKDMTVEHLIDRHSFLAAVFFDDLREFAEIVNHVYQVRHRWAACFDEVEIAPDPVKAPIWQSARSFDPRYLIKLSASPYDDLSRLFDPRMPVPEHDFRRVDLSQRSRSEVFSFSQRLFTGICREFGMPPRAAETVLGPSLYDDAFETENQTAMGPDSGGYQPATMDRSVAQGLGGRLAPTGFYNRKFQSLARKDPSFAEYLKARDIDFVSMAQLPEFKKAALIRKTLGTVVVRDEFLADQSRDGRETRRQWLRSRKTVPDIYTGALSIFTICEGNPRWLIGLLRPLIEEFAYHKDKHQKDKQRIRRIQRNLQAKRIERTITTLFTLLSTLRSYENGEAGVSIIDLLEQLGNYSMEQVLGPTFNPEPILSFMIDRNVSPPLYKAIGNAINQGALV